MDYPTTCNSNSILPIAAQQGIIPVQFGFYFRGSSYDLSKMDMPVLKLV